MLAMHVVRTTKKFDAPQLRKCIKFGNYHLKSTNDKVLDLLLPPFGQVKFFLIWKGFT